MKTLLKALLFVPAIALGATVEITPPTRYTNGEALPPSSIKHYELCTISANKDCESILKVNGMFNTDILPANTIAVKARTVTITGAVSDWSNVIDEPFKRPLPPTLSIKIIVEVSTNTIGAD